jgi:hypothetical protein
MNVGGLPTRKTCQLAGGPVYEGEWPIARQGCRFETGKERSVMREGAVRYWPRKWTVTAMWTGVGLPFNCAGSYFHCLTASNAA